MLKAVIFDMDGVIIDSETMHRKAYHDMFDDVGIIVPVALYESFTGKSTLNICKQLCEHFNLRETPETLVALKRKHYKTLFNTDTTFGLIDGVLALIKNYHDNGLTLVLASSASMSGINLIFERFDLNQYFKAKLSGADLRQSKPHPEIFEKAAKASGSNKNECFVIEDSTNGIQAAISAGIYCVGYDSFHSKNQDYSKANMVISNFEAIYFDKISKKFN
ncbi:HAD family hydrolase [Hyunsoonleella sp. 2307UL5-6]|uniref:HAD family hydrolase n=1 Tax=Hyunsoonleella sp. 2307UL5-6 TaxID=3384768 RepID=UPI0039BD8B4D